MSTLTRTRTISPPPDLDPSGVPSLDRPISAHRRRRVPRLTGLAPGSAIALVQLVDPPRRDRPWIWGLVDGGRTILFQVDEATARDLQAASDAGEEPSVIVEPAQIVATMDVEPARRYCHAAPGTVLQR